MTDATKATLLLGALALAAVSGGIYGWVQSRGRTAALHQAAIAEGEALAERQAKEKAKAERAAADQVAKAQTLRVAQLQAELDRHPRPAPAQPVPADAPVAVVVAGLQQLGLRPQPLGPAVKDSLTAQTPALALTLPDGRTVLAWGRDALRVPGLEARLDTLQDLTRAQADQAAAKDQQLAATDRALAASEAEAAALRRQAAALQRAVDLTPRWRPRAAGLIVGLDAQGQRHLGALASYTLGPVEVGGLYLNHTAGAYAAIRF